MQKDVMVAGIFKIAVENQIEQYRADTFWTKEPETVAWIASFNSGDVFMDIGANVGIYSLYAAALDRNRIIYALEPDIPNYLRLRLNRATNRFHNIKIFNLALAGKTDIGQFYVS